MNIEHYTPMNERITLDPKIIQKVKERFAYKLLNNRKFAEVKGYAAFTDIILVMATNLELAETGCQMLTNNNRWLWLCTVDMFARAGQYNTFPVYRVDEELLNLFLEAEDPKQFKQIQPQPVESALFLFPKGQIKVGCQCIDWLMVDYVDTRERSNEFEFDGGSVIFERLSVYDNIRYRWATQTRSEDREYPGDLFVSTFGYTSEGTSAPGELTGLRQIDADLTTLLTRISKHLLLWLQQPKEYEYVEVTRARGFGKTFKNDKPAPRYPIKLSIDDRLHKIYKPAPRDDRPTSETENPRKSPEPHDRCAHWRYVPVGPRSEGRRELKFIRSTKVNAKELTPLGINKILKGNPDSQNNKSKNLLKDCDISI